MEKNYLLESLASIQQVSEATFLEYQNKSDRLQHRMNTLMMERADLVKLIGKNNISMMKDNHANHVLFIASILKNYNKEVLLDTVLWVFRAYRSHGFPSSYWAAQLNGWMVILKEELSEANYTEIFPYYEWMLVNIALFVKYSDEKLEMER